MTLPFDPSRLLRLDGTFNTRDLGGIPLAGGTLGRGRVLRSDGLHGLSDADRSLLADLGLRTVVDLRSAEEQAERPSALAGLDAELVSLPVFAGRMEPKPGETRTLRNAYATMIEACAAPLVEAVETLARPGALPALVHCTAGKDRTGVVVALTLDLLGVADELIIGDYAVSAGFLGPAFVAHVGLDRPAGADGGNDEATMADMLSSPPELIRDTLNDVRRRYGSVEQYLLDHGLDAGTPDRLRAALPVHPATSATTPPVERVYAG
ncbi:MAG: tyrosine-protein phosphatase [Acidimicrobiales bacterium]